MVSKTLLVRLEASGSGEPYLVGDLEVGKAKDGRAAWAVPPCFDLPKEPDAMRIVD